MPVLRIALFGPESTGKSTLAEQVAAHFDEPWVPEYVREFWDVHEATIVAADLDAIARGQIAHEDAAAARARRAVFCDTELLTNVLWADLLFPGHCPPWVRAAAEERCRRFSLYLFCDTDLPWEPDPQRCFPDEAGRAMCRRLWLDTLTSRGLPHVRLSGDLESRRALAIAAVEDILAK